MFCADGQVGLPVIGVVENMSGFRHRLGDFRFLRGSASGGAEADVTAAVLERLREVAPELEVSENTIIKTEPPTTSSKPSLCHDLLMR